MPLAGRSSKSQRRLARFETCQSTRTLLALCATGETSRTETELRGPMPMTRRGGCSPARTGHQFDQTPTRRPSRGILRLWATTHLAARPAPPGRDEAARGRSPRPSRCRCSRSLFNPCHQRHLPTCPGVDRGTGRGQNCRSAGVKPTYLSDLLAFGAPAITRIRSSGNAQSSDIQTRLHVAARHVASSRLGAELFKQPELLEPRGATVETAALVMVFGSGQTSIDLCAASVLRWHGNVPSRNEYDFRSLRKAIPG